MDEKPVSRHAILAIWRWPKVAISLLVFALLIAYFASPPLRMQMSARLFHNWKTRAKFNRCFQTLEEPLSRLYRASPFIARLYRRESRLIEAMLGPEMGTGTTFWVSDSERKILYPMRACPDD